MEPTRASRLKPFSTCAVNDLNTIGGSYGGLVIWYPRVIIDHHVFVSAALQMIWIWSWVPLMPWCLVPTLAMRPPCFYTRSEVNYLNTTVGSDDPLVIWCSRYFTRLKYDCWSRWCFGDMVPSLDSRLPCFHISSPINDLNTLASSHCALVIWSFPRIRHHHVFIPAAV